MKLFTMLLAVAALLAAGCSPLALLNTFVPRANHERIAGVAYGDLPRQALDIYVPDPAAFPGTRGVIVFFYGGSWQHGERADFRFVGEALASRGFVAVIPDYRVFPEVRYPAFVEDAARAFAWARRGIGAHHGDAGRMFLMGHSAGAHIATMLAYNPRFLRGVGLERADVRGVIGLSGPYDFVPTDPAIRELLSGEGAPREAMPATFVRGGEPPSLLIQGTDDTTVEPGNQARLAARLRAVGSTVEEIKLPGYGHAATVARLAAPIRDDRLLEAIAAFAGR